MGAQCVLCKQNGKASEGMSYHKVPKNETLRSQWISSLRIRKFMFSDSSVICGAHFTRDCFVPHNLTAKTLLRPGSIPTIIDVQSEQFTKDCFVPHKVIAKTRSIPLSIDVKSGNFTKVQTNLRPESIPTIIDVQTIKEERDVPSLCYEEYIEEDLDRNPGPSTCTIKEESFEELTIEPCVVTFPPKCDRVSDDFKTSKGSRRHFKTAVHKCKEVEQLKNLREKHRTLLKKVKLMKHQIMVLKKKNLISDEGEASLMQLIM